MSVSTYLQEMREKQASDLFLTVGYGPTVKAHGHLVLLDPTPLTPEQVNNIANEIMADEQKIKEFEQTREMNLAIEDPQHGRFRVNIFQQCNYVGIVIRSISAEIPAIEALGLPPVLKSLIMEKRGLILVVGATSSGKSTTLASMIGYRNANQDGHIISIEDPIEFIHKHNKSIISQREVGVDTESYAAALKNTLRQAPDVILIGEIRTKETMEYALTFAKTGHLCLSTLHANNANQAMERIINFFPRGGRDSILYDISTNIVGVISQRLIPSNDGKRAVAVEVLTGTPMVKELIKRGNTTELKDIMEKSETQGMQTFDMALFNLVQTGKITEEEALKHADSANNLRLRFSLSKSAEQNAESGLSLVKEKAKHDDKGKFL